MAYFSHLPYMHCPALPLNAVAVKQKVLGLFAAFSGLLSRNKGHYSIPCQKYEKQPFLSSKTVNF